MVWLDCGQDNSGHPNGKGNFHEVRSVSRPVRHIIKPMLAGRCERPRLSALRPAGKPWPNRAARPDRQLPPASLKNIAPGPENGFFWSACCMDTPDFEAFYRAADIDGRPRTSGEQRGGGLLLFPGCDR